MKGIKEVCVLQIKRVFSIMKGYSRKPHENRWKHPCDVLYIKITGNNDINFKIDGRQQKVKQELMYITPFTTGIFYKTIYFTNLKLEQYIITLILHLLYQG